MRVGPVGWAFATLEETLAEAEKSAACSHNHPEGIKGAQAVAAAIFWARNGESKDFIRDAIAKRFGYNMSRTCEEIRPDYKLAFSCAETVPEALTAFLDAKDFEEAVRLAVAFGGDADTMGSVAGAVAEAFWGVESIPPTWRAECAKRLDPRLKAVVDEFNARFRPGVAAIFSVE
jgi:ADP-ribosylglycohydrolase